MNTRLRFTLCLALLVAAVAAWAADKSVKSPPRFDDLVREFDYGRNALLNIREEHKEERDGATVIELSYDSPRGGRVPATLVLPPGKGPFAGILFGHWMMPRSPVRNRKEFLEEALLLARAGAVSLLTDAPMVRPGFLPEKDELKGEIQNAEASRQQVIDFRRGNRDRENRDHHAGGILRLGAETPESDEVQIRSREHELDPDENKNRVPPAQRREQANREKRGRDDEAELESRRHRFSSMTRTSAPIKAAVRRSPTHCSGQT